MVKKKTGRFSESWYKSRRVWSFALSLLVVIAGQLFGERYDLIEPFAIGVAGLLGLSSWVMPKQ